MMEATAPTAEAAGGPPPEPEECPAASPSRKRPRTAAADGGGAPGRRVLIYTTCYNVIDGVTLTIRKIEQEILSAGDSVCILTTRSGDAANTHALSSPYEDRNDADTDTCCNNSRRQILFLDNSIPIP